MMLLTTFFFIHLETINVFNELSFEFEFNESNKEGILIGHNQKRLKKSAIKTTYACNKK